MCESDSDCRFYGAVYDAITATMPATPKQELLFARCGGKARIPTVVDALRHLNVPVHVVADFDILNDEKPLRPVFEGLGGTWDNISGDWKRVKTSIDQKKPELSSSEITQEIQKPLANIMGPFFPQKAKQQIQDILRRSSPWAQAKTTGETFIPNGEPYQRYQRLVGTCRAKGLFIVGAGELEEFDKGIGNHGPEWVNTVLEKRELATAPELEQARQFVRQLTAISETSMTVE